MSLKQKFTEHPASVGESYFEHMAVASSFSLHLFKAAFACAVHAILPFMFEKTGSECIDCLHERMVTHRDRRKAQGNEATA